MHTSLLAYPQLREHVREYSFFVALTILISLLSAVAAIALVHHLELILTSSRLAVIGINPQLTVGRVPVVTARGDSHSPSLLLHSLRGWWVGHITSLLA